MSIMQRILNPWLRAVEKRRMKTGTPAQLRRALAGQSRMFFHAPRGTVYAQETYDDVPCQAVTPRGASEERVLFYIHGGAFVFGSPSTHSAMVASLAQRIGARGVMPKYRLAPEAPFPAAPDDVRAAWEGLLRSGVTPESIVVGGDSAGGALAFGLVASLRAEGAPMPGAVFGFSPLTDLTHSGESFRTNAEADVVLPAESADKLGALFLRGASPETPSVSPLFGDFEGAPPAWITVGDTEVLLDDGRRLAEKLRSQGVDTTLQVERDLPHVWPIFHNVLPEGRQTLDALAQWIRQRQNWVV
ncbi:alpha/beta hydrolase [uncultured Sulfitobacter sp.]|uniref:alpha/beta hydrolase n=1 Tax=uncultured Sulfitobacter sp. TaxID=191468 RepID=UPI00262CE1A2|nr:alpha/beta hydrolase [uncultured Sulfitobacter sp.]